MVKVIDLNQSVPIITVRTKRSDDSTLAEATKKGNYNYWLSQEDIANIARIEYKNYCIEDSYYAVAEFEIIGSLDQLQHQLEKFWFRSKTLATHRLTLIINLSNQHWVTLIVSKTHFAADALYVDSQGTRLSNQYYRLISNFGITINDLSTLQQTDGCNCGLWALENAADLNQMLEEGKPYEWIINQLSRPRDNDYFRERRQILSLKLEADITRSKRLLRLPHSHDPIEANGENSKRMKGESKQEKVRILLNTYVETFMSSFIKRLAAYHLTAKSERLTLEALLTELKTGSTAALMGAFIAQSITGTIPSLVSSLRLLGSKYYLPKNKAQKITRIFSNVQPGDLSQILAETGVEIFQSFESQFMHVSDKAGDKVAMEKLAEDAVGRALNYIVESTDDSFISKELILTAILLGKSEKFFDPSFKSMRVRMVGSLLQDKQGNKLTTAQLYKKVGLVEVSSQSVAYKFYKKITTDPESTQYGYRRLLSIEKTENGELKETLKKSYQYEAIPTEETVLQRSLKDYAYILQLNTYQQEAEQILNKIKDRYPAIEKTKKLPSTKTSILFDLKRPVDNFTGRVEVPETLHRILMSGKMTAVVTAFSELSVSPNRLTESSSLSGGQVSVSGVGGIGKTQLALRYAELYAADYDNNIIWINSETERDLAYSFNKLATKLNLETKDRYGRDREVTEITEKVFEYFSDRKSLFIFDNVKNYREIEDFLPKPLPGNRPSIIITSRYQNWQNVALVINLAVFTEQETLQFVRKGLNLVNDNTQDSSIKELNNLLQGLPLALQQAISYILNQQVLGSFTVQDYIAVYKQKTKELLDFDLVRYSNDPYAKTVYTTWGVTLDKIKLEPSVGEVAIEILNIMAYLCPDNINNTLFFSSI